MRVLIFAVAAAALLALLFGCIGSGQIKRGVDSRGMQYMGADGAKVTIVVFSDFQCPFCSAAQQIVERLLREYDGKVKLVYRHYPLPEHPNAFGAAIAAECAAEQGKFWEMHDLMHANQNSLDKAGLKALAAKAQLQYGAYDACLEEERHRGRIEKDMAEGRMLGVRATPTFFIGTQVFEGAPYEKMKAAIESGLKEGG